VARIGHASIVLVVSLSYLSYVFDIFHDTFWKAGLGDWIDPYFINYLLEHWYHSVTSFNDPSSPPMFFPARGTLGYSHGLVLYAPFYVTVRLFFHAFQAYSLCLFVVIETGILCLYLIFRRFFDLSFVESLLLTVFFFTSQNVINGTVGVWSQRASVFLIPPILLLLLVSLREPPGRRRVVLAGMSGCLATLLFPHDFYTAQFAFFFAAWFLAAAAFIEWHAARALSRLTWWRNSRAAERIALVATAITGLWTAYLWTSGGVRTQLLGVKIASQDWRRPALLMLACVAAFAVLRGVQRIKTDFRDAFEIDFKPAAPWLWAFLSGAALGVAVFLWIYLPAYLEHPQFPQQDLLNQIRVRVSSRWTSPITALRDLGVYDTFRSFKLVFIVGILAWMPWFKVDRKTRWYALWAMMVTGLVFIIPLRIDSFSIWLTFIRRVPGFSVIRDPTRIIFLYELAFILAAGLCLTRFRDRFAYRVGICLLFLFFLITDHRADVLGYERPLNVYHRWVESSIDIDPACRSFFIEKPSAEYLLRSDNTWALTNIDATFISLNIGLPTLNGYSAWAPEGWNLMNPPEPEYWQRARAWSKDHHLEGVCALDIDARTMRIGFPR
jgi:hypothetical protein